MIEQTKLSPKRRFKDFQNNPSWENREIGEVLKINSGRDYKHLDVGDIPVYGTGGYMLSVNDKLSIVDGIGIGRKGTIDKPQYLRAPFWTVDTLFFMTPLANYDIDFLFSMSQNIKWRQLDESTGVPSLSKVIIEKVIRNFPSYEEQKRIGSFFRHLDNLITLQQRKLEKTKELKTAYLSEMFPAEDELIPKQRFAGFTQDWEKRKFGELANIVRGASPRPIQDSKWFDEKSDIGWLRITDVSEQNGRIHYLKQRLSVAGQEKTRVLTEPHLLLSIAATVGKPVVNYVNTGVHDGFLIFQDPLFDREFMFQWLEMFRPKWKKYGQPGSQVNLNSDLVKNQEIILPSFEEQLKIGNFFKQLDDIITHHQSKLDKLQNLKKAYLTEMFV